MASLLLKEKVIKCVLERPMLWDKYSPSYGVTNAEKNKQWIAIAEELGMGDDAETVHKCWRHMRDHYVRKKKAHVSGTNEGCQCFICLRLKFLDGYIIHRNKPKMGGQPIETKPKTRGQQQSNSRLPLPAGSITQNVVVLNGDSVLCKTANGEPSKAQKTKPVKPTLKKAFSATFTIFGKPLVEISGDFENSPKVIRGLLHNMFTYLQKKDAEASVEFSVANSSEVDYFGLMCLSPTLKPYFGFEESPHVPKRRSMRNASRNISFNENDDESESEESSVKKVKVDPLSEEFESCYEPAVVLDEGQSDGEVKEEVAVSDFDDDKIFSEETFASELPSASESGEARDEESGEAHDEIENDIKDKGDEFDKYFENISEKKKKMNELRRARARERDRLLPRRVSQPPSLELISRRIAIAHTLFPSRVNDEEETERLTALFKRNRMGELFEEIKSMVDDPNCTFKCPRCDEGIEGKEQYVAHHHICCAGPVLYYCMFCEQIRHEEELVNHLRSHLYDDGCLICDVPSIKTYQQHRDLHLPPERFTSDIEEHEKARYSCRMCESQEKLFKKDRDHFRRHLIWSHSNPGQCEMCGMKFQSHSKLRFHRRSAHHEPQNCGKCGKFLATYTHLRRHCCENETRICEICGKVLKRHQMNRHLKEVHNMGAKIFKCDYCDATFTRIFPMKQHMNIHLGDKPYICLICNKRHTSLAALGGHTRARHDMTATEMRERVKNGTVSVKVEDEGSESDEESYVLGVYASS